MKLTPEEKRELAAAAATIQRLVDKLNEESDDTDHDEDDETQVSSNAPGGAMDRGRRIDDDDPRS